MSNPPPSVESEPVWQPSRHSDVLDGVRGLAILIVTIYRFTKELPLDSTVGYCLFKFCSLGSRGVDLFFVLSGFLITGVLLQSKGQALFFRKFYWRRSLRIFPLYFASLWALLIIYPYVFSAALPAAFQEAKRQQIYLWTYTSNVAMSLRNEWCFGAMDHFWSLAVEEHFYLFWPIFIFALSARYALKMAIGLAVLATVSRIVYVIISDYGVAADVLTCFRLDALSLGAALSIAMRLYPDWLGQASVRTLAGWALLPIALLSMAMEFTGQGLASIPHTFWEITWLLALYLIITSRSTDGIVVLLSSRFLRMLGKYSYAMYVFQSPQIALVQPVLSVAMIASVIPSGVLSVLVYALLMFSINLGCAILSWHILEKHCLKLKDRLTVSRRRT